MFGVLHFAVTPLLPSGRVLKQVGEYVKAVAPH